MSISVNDLRLGYQKGKTLSFRLYKDAELFYEEGRYSTSISIMILLREELAKLNLIRKHIQGNIELSKSKWKKVSQYGSHTFKLKKLYEESLETINKLNSNSYNQIIDDQKKIGSRQDFKKFVEIKKNNPLLRKRLESLNGIKKACWYLDWQNSRWVTLTSVYTEKELELFANYFLQITGYELMDELINFKYPYAWYYQVPPEISLLRQDPLWQKCQEYYDLLESENFKKIIELSNRIIDNFPLKLDQNPLDDNQTAWPIPKKEYFNGGILSLKHAKKLLGDAKFALDKKRYAIALLLAVLSFEEFGKHFLFREKIDQNILITDEMWNKNFSSHFMKLKSMLIYLDTITKQDLQKEFQNEANELRVLIKEWMYKKLSTIYLHWDEDNQNWYTFDDLDDETKANEINYAINIIERFFTIYSDEMKNPNFLTIDELTNLVKNQKLLFECVECKKTFVQDEEIITHSNNFPEHNVGYNIIE